MKISVFYHHVLDAIKNGSLDRGELFDELKASGYDGFEVSTGSYENAAELGKEFAAHGIGVSCLCVHLRLDSENDVSAWKQAVHDARDMGSKKLLVVPGFARDGLTLVEARRNIAGPLSQIVEYAAGFGITVVIEDFDSSDSPIMDSKGMIALADMVPGLKFAFDTGNFRYCGEDEFLAFDALKSRIAHVHLKDREYSPINIGDSVKIAMDGQTLYPSPFGFGKIKTRELLDKLCEIGYDDYAVVEHYGASDQKDFMLKSAKWLKEYFKNR